MNVWMDAWKDVWMNGRKDALPKIKHWTLSQDSSVEWLHRPASLFLSVGHSQLTDKANHFPLICEFTDAGRAESK